MAKKKKTPDDKENKQESKPKRTKDSVEKILKTFKDNLYGVKFFFNKFGGIAESEDKGALDSTFEFTKEIMKDLGIDIDEDNKEKDKSKKKESKKEKSKVSEEKLLEIAKKFRKKPKLSVQNFQILSSSSFLMLNNYFEYLIADLLTYHYTKYKETLNSKEFKVSLKEIEEYESVQELEKHLIFKEVETMLIEMSFDSILKHFNSKLKINLYDEIIDWDIINECRERRHIIVHNASVVNKKYLSRTNNPESKKVGDKVRVSKEYFQKVFREIKLAGLLLAYDCWGNWDSDKATKAIRDMLDETFESLLEDENDFCYNLTSFMENLEPRNAEQEDFMLRAKFNRCITLKKQKKTTELNKILKSIKVGTSLPLFKLAHAILSNKPDKTILELIEQSFKLEEIDYDSYSEWPIFEFVRSKKRLNSQIEKILKN